MKTIHVGQYAPPSVPISDGTRLMVQQAAEEFQYYPGCFARSLRTKSSRIIGVVVSDIADSQWLLRNSHGRALSANADVGPAAPIGDGENRSVE